MVVTAKLAQRHQMQKRFTLKQAAEVIAEELSVKPNQTVSEIAAATGFSEDFVRSALVLLYDGLITTTRYSLGETSR